jgi:prophage antirepressor-like protein
MKYQIIRLHGGGKFHFYLTDGCKILDVTHQDDVIGMKRLKDKKLELENEQKESFKIALE